VNDATTSSGQYQRVLLAIAGTAVLTTLLVRFL
jgi:hypothetical protein